MAAPFGLGFGTGILDRLGRNAEQSSEDERIQAILMGELLGNKDLLRPEEKSLLPTTTEPRSALTSIGSMFTGGNRAGINSMLTLRGILAGRAKAAQQEEVRLTQLTNFLQNSEEPLNEQQKASLLSSFKNPKVKFFAEIALKNAEIKQGRLRDAENLLSRGVEQTKDIAPTEVIEGDIGGVQTVRRPATREEKLAAFFKIHPKTVIEKMSAEPREDPTSLIHPGPGTPASIVNRRTGAWRTLPGTERTSTRTPAQESADTARANYYNALAKSPRGGVMFNEFLRQGGNPDDEDAFLDYVAKRRKAGQEPKASQLETETLLEEATKYAKPREVLKAINEGKLSPEIGKKILQQKFGFKEKAKR